jgi:hypothetical protein
MHHILSNLDIEHQPLEWEIAGIYPHSAKGQTHWVWATSSAWEDDSLINEQLKQIRESWPQIIP